MLSIGRVLGTSILLLIATHASAFESQWLSGLHITTERLTGQLGFNGVLFRVQRATGPDVRLLADRILRDWRVESGRDGVIPLTNSGWNMYSRISRGESEVVQWREAGFSSELLWSVTDLRTSPDAPPASGVPLPPACQWLPPVHGTVRGTTFIQTTGSCAGDAQGISSSFTRLLASRGWTANRWSGGMLDVQRGKQRAQITLMQAQDPGRTRTHAVILELGDRSSTP